MDVDTEDVNDADEEPQASGSGSHTADADIQMGVEVGEELIPTSRAAPEDLDFTLTPVVQSSQLPDLDVTPRPNPPPHRSPTPFDDDDSAKSTQGQGDGAVEDPASSSDLSSDLDPSSQHGEEEAPVSEESEDDDGSDCDVAHSTVGPVETPTRTSSQLPRPWHVLTSRVRHAAST